MTTRSRLGLEPTPKRSPIRAPVRLALQCLAAIVLSLLPLNEAAADRLCDTRHAYEGNFPENVSPGWHSEAQGLAQDGSHWYISQNAEGGTHYGPHLWRIHNSRDLSRVAECDDPGVLCSESFADEAPDLWDQGYDHFGDISVHEGIVVVPIERSGEDDPGPALLGFYDASTLELVDVVTVQGAGGSFAAVDPEGLVYMAMPKQPTLARLSLDWGAVGEEGFRVRWRQPLRLHDEAGAPLTISALQGGAFGRDDRILYLASGFTEDLLRGGLHVFDVQATLYGGRCSEGSSFCRARRIERSENRNVMVERTGWNGQPTISKIEVEPETDFVFTYDSHALEYEEPEGLTVWDFDLVDDGASTRTHLHALLLDNDYIDVPYSDEDDIYVKHYSADIDCPSDPAIEILPDPAGNAAATIFPASQEGLVLYPALIDGIGMDLEPGQRWLSGDFDGDGVGDLAVVFERAGGAIVRTFRSNGRSYVQMSEQSLGAGMWTSQVWESGDFDGDGRDDLLLVYGHSRYGATSMMWRSNGSGFHRRHFQRMNAGFWKGQRWEVGDVDGDGRDDVVLVYGHSRYGATAWIYRSLGTSFTRVWTQRLSAGFSEDQRWLLADIDGDGRDDLTLVYDHSRWGTALWVYRVPLCPTKSISSCRFERASRSRLPVEFDRGQRWEPGDYDGDGRGDLKLVTRHGSQSEVRFFRSNGYTLYQAKEEYLRVPFVAGEPWLVGDFDADGLDDLTVIHRR